MNRDEIIARARAEAGELSVASVDAKPEDFDFSEGYGETWEYLEAIECDECDQIILNGDEHGFVDEDDGAVELPDDLTVEDDLDELKEWAEEHGYQRCSKEGTDARDLYAEGPMMNYRYPTEADYDEDNARKLVHSNLCLVYDNTTNDTYLALTGGGMDMSWQICGAYVALGYLPPTHFSLPNMAGTVLTPHTALIIAAVERANNVQVSWAQSGVERAARFFAELPLPE